MLIQTLALILTKLKGIKKEKVRVDPWIILWLSLLYTGQSLHKKRDKSAISGQHLNKYRAKRGTSYTGSQKRVIPPPLDTSSISKMAETRTTYYVTKDRKLLYPCTRSRGTHNSQCSILWALKTPFIYNGISSLKMTDWIGLWSGLRTNQFNVLTFVDSFYRGVSSLKEWMPCHAVLEE